MSDCKGIALSCRLFEAGTDAGGTLIDGLIQDIQDGMVTLIKMLTTFWVEVPTGTVAADSGVSGFLTSYLNPYVVAAAMVSLLIGGMKIILTQRAQPAVEVATGLTRLLLVSLLAIPLISMLAQLSDEVSIGIIDASITDGDFGSNLLSMMQLGGTYGPQGKLPGVGLFITLLLGLAAAPAALIQAALMFVRAIMVPILAGILVLSASFWTTELGQQWYRRSTTWLVAFLVYKPAASIIYASGFVLMGQYKIADAEGVGGVALAVFMFLRGMIVMGLAVISIGPLIGFAVPVASSMAGKGGQGMMFASAATGVVAAGAISNGRSGGRGPSGPSAPAGASGSQGTPAPYSPGGAGGAGKAGATGASGMAGASGAAGAAGGAIGVATKVAGEGAKAVKGAADNAVGSQEDNK